MVRIMLGRGTPYRALDGNCYEERAEIEHETERAYLLLIQRGPVVYKYWIPKSISLRLESFIEVPDWFWNEVTGREVPQMSSCRSRMPRSRRG